MDEVRRFARYILPGLVYLVQVIVALLITFPVRLDTILSHLKEYDSLFIGLGALLGSGAIGFILSSIYWVLFWFPVCNMNLALNHGDFFSYAERYEYFHFLDFFGAKIAYCKLDKRYHHKIITRLWRTSLRKSKAIEGIHPWVSRIIDLQHGVGASIVGTILAILTWWYVIDLEICDGLCNGNSGVFLIWWVIFLSCCIFSYFSTRNLLQGVINATMIELISEFSGKNCAPEWIKIRMINTMYRRSLGTRLCDYFQGILKKN